MTAASGGACCCCGCCWRLFFARLPPALPFTNLPEAAASTAGSLGRLGLVSDAERGDGMTAVRMVGSSVQLHAAQWTPGGSGQSNNYYLRSGLTRPRPHQTRLRGSFHGDRGGRSERGLSGPLWALGLNTPTPLPCTTLRMITRMLLAVRSTPTRAMTVRTKRTAGPPVVLPADRSSP